MDALIFEDLEYLKKKPTFGMLISEGAMVERMRSIYPSLTYPCHTTMVTGCYPDKHGIVNNTFFTLDKDPPWIFDHSNVKCEDIHDVCKKAGLMTASVGWPVTGNHKSVDHLVNECWPEKGAPTEAYKEAYLKNGTSERLFDEAVAPYLFMRVGRKQPGSSWFLIKISSDIIRLYKPDILTIHIGNVDSYRHKTGVFSDLVRRGLDECENMMVELIQAVKDAGVFENTNFVVTADHGQLNTARTVNLNRLFASEGLIKTKGDGSVEDYDAWCLESGMSAQIYLKDPNDEKSKQKVYDLLKEKRDEGLWGISEVYTREEFNMTRLDGDFSFVVETDGSTSFGNDWTGAYAKAETLSLCGCIGGNHGYHPDKAARPPFIAYGPDFIKGAVLSGAELVDGAPTYAKVLGVELKNADGRPLTELIKSGDE